MRTRRLLPPVFAVALLLILALFALRARANDTSPTPTETPTGVAAELAPLPAETAAEPTPSELTPLDPFPTAPPAEAAPAELVPLDSTVAPPTAAPNAPTMAAEPSAPAVVPAVVEAAPTVAVAAADTQAISSAVAPGLPDTATLVTVPSPPDGAALMASLGDSYLSPVTRAPRPFTHVLLRWDASVPVSATVQLEIRASLDGEQWTDWGTVLENHDLWVPEDGPDRFWSQEIYAGEGAQFWQVRARMEPAPDGSTPQLRAIDVNTVDARFGPEEPAPAPPAAGLLADLSAVGRPAVVSRSAWGSPDGQGSRVAPAYRRVNHMVVHHTADSNSLAPGQRWSDRVRAIWSFHTNTRGWGDIGYNFLVDPNGVIYEGRAGGDDAVGFHDTANYGSMGVAMIGTYNGAPPPGPALDGLVNLLAWKADQRDIDPYGRSYYHGCTLSQSCRPFYSDGIVPNIGGHRDITPNRTTCPGNAIHALLPGIRQRVAQRLEGGAPPPADPVKLDLVNVAYDQRTVAAGELLKVTFTIRNSGSVAVEGQAPEATRDQAGAVNLADSYVYDEGECFLGDGSGSAPAHPKESGRIRIMLGPVEEGRQPPCDGGTGGYPWRWGINGRLEPGQSRDVVGYIRLRTPGTITLRAGLINEYVGYLAESVAATPITVTPERQMPAPAAYDEALRAEAHLYRLAELPANLVARVRDGAGLPRGAYLGSFPWQGEPRAWGAVGPLPGAALNGRYVVEQTRVFVAAAPGSYEFRLATGEAGWLWVNGELVTGGQGTTSDLVGSVELPAGRHVIALRAIGGASERAMGYTVKIPGSTTYGPLGDGLSGAEGAPAERIGAVYRRFTGLSIVADDMGGSGVARMRYALNGGPWNETPGPIATLGALVDGEYTLRYSAFDTAGNQSEERTLRFRVDSTLQTRQLYLPMTRR